VAGALGRRVRRVSVPPIAGSLVRGRRYGPPVSAVPLVLAALALAPATLRHLLAHGHVRPNYRGASLAFPLGFLIAVAATLALVPLSLLREIGAHGVLGPQVGSVLIYVLGVGVLGLVDDLLGDERSRGWRGHGAVLRGGGLSTGALKATGALGLALYTLGGQGRPAPQYLLACVLLVLATNLFNLLDLRPGRSIKAFIVLGLALTLGAWDLGPLWTLGLFVGPLLVAGIYDLRERAMLGDSGSNVVGALAGLWLVLTLSVTGQVIATGLIAAITVYGEFRSISTLVESTPVLRHLDSLGRPLHV